MSNNNFDVQKFYAALDLTRQSRNMSWKQVANQSEVSASTLTRMGQGKKPDVDGLVALSSWANLDIREFYSKSLDRSVNPEPLAEISALLRADSKLNGRDAKMLEAMLASAYEHLRSSSEWSKDTEGGS